MNNSGKRKAGDKSSNILTIITNLSYKDSVVASVVSAIPRNWRSHVEMMIEIDAASANLKAGVQVDAAGFNPALCPVTQERSTEKAIAAHTSPYGLPQVADSFYMSVGRVAARLQVGVDMAKNLI